MLSILKTRFYAISGEIFDLRYQVSMLDFRLFALEFRTSTTSLPRPTSISDIIERDRCKSNIIVRDLPNLSSKIADDKNSLAAIFVSIKPTEFKPIRRKKYATSSTRPTKVIFNSQDLAADILSFFWSTKLQSSTF